MAIQHHQRKSPSQTNKMTRESRKKVARASIAISQLLFINLFATLTLLTANTSSFSFWPTGKFLNLNQARTSDRPSATETATKTPPPPPTTTTTTTTTQMPPIELHFEINPEDLTSQAQQQQQQLARLPESDAVNLAENENDLQNYYTPANGSLILEDLVNQFEQQFNQQKQRFALVVAGGGSNATTPPPPPPPPRASNLTRNLNAGKRFEKLESTQSDTKQRESIENKRNGSDRNAHELVEPTTTTENSKVQLQAGVASHEQNGKNSLSNLKSEQDLDRELAPFGPTPDDTLVERLPPDEPDPDRHIQYDFTNVNSHSSNEQDDEDQQQQQQQQQTSTSKPHFATEADHFRQSNATNGRLMENYKLSQSELEQISNESQAANEQIVNLTEKVLSQHNRAANLVAPILIVSKSLQNVTSNRANSRNDSAVLPLAISSTRALAANQIQARSLHSNGQNSGVVATATTAASRTAQHSKPPYASYNQFNPHRGGDTSPSGPDRRAPTSSGAQLTKAQKEESPNGGELLATSISSISSLLMGNDASGSELKTIESAPTNRSEILQGTVAPSMTSNNLKAKIPAFNPMIQATIQLNASNNFSERRDASSSQAEAELERMANKLAPVNELTELSPIESSSSSSRRTMIPADYPADSAPQEANSVLLSRYHAEHYDPYLTQATSDKVGLSEPANSMSSYLQSLDLQATIQQQQQPPQRAHDVKSGAPAAAAAAAPTAINENSSDYLHVRYTNSLDSVPHLHAAAAPSPNGAPPMQVHRKTLESLSNQIQNSDGHLISGNTLAIHQHKERSPPTSQATNNQKHQQQMSAHNNRGATGSLSLANGLQMSSHSIGISEGSNALPAAAAATAATLQGGAPKRQAGGAERYHAASLINVTAPMVLPLSATEAMEATLGASSDPAARQMIHQAGGRATVFNGAQQSSLNVDQQRAAASDVQIGEQQQQQRTQNHAPTRSGYYHASLPVGQNQAAGVQTLAQTIYSRPANQFRAPLFSLSASTQQQQQQTTPAAAAEPFDQFQASPISSGSMSTPPTSSASQNGGPTSAFLSASERERMRLGDQTAATTPAHFSSGPAPPPPTAANQQASGFRSPLAQFLAAPASYLSASVSPSSSNSQASHNNNNKYTTSSTSLPPTLFATLTGNNGGPDSSAIRVSHQQTKLQSAGGGAGGNVGSQPATTNGFITSSSGASLPSAANTNNSSANSLVGIVSTNDMLPSQSTATATATTTTTTIAGVNQLTQQQQQQANAILISAPGKRVFNLTRVEHISAECSNDLIRTVIIFNGTFKGIIYSSGYVRDSNCLYINGTGKTRYDFSIKLNQCGTLNRQEIHQAGSSNNPSELRRRDQVMWNTLSIQYNPIIEQEWDEHFRVSCEYGSDFWKTISFSPFNVETNTGSPVVFTVDPPQCQMEILKGHGMVGPRQETITGPVTVGDPLTLLIHMKSEKAGYDILVKNCIAHNGGQQKMQLIDTNGCVVNERFISPFRGTYNDNDLKHVTLYSYLKAFRFTGSPVLYLECEVHMCQSACPPQMCYWRRLSKRSTRLGNLAANDTQVSLVGNEATQDDQFEDYHNYGPSQETAQTNETNESYLVKTIRFNTTTTTTEQPPNVTTRRGQQRALAGGHRRARELSPSGASREDDELTRGESSFSGSNKKQENLSDKISLFQALEVRQEREPDASPSVASATYPHDLSYFESSATAQQAGELDLHYRQLMCYQKVEIFAFLFTVASILLAAISVTIGCYYRAINLKQRLATSVGPHLLYGETRTRTKRKTSRDNKRTSYLNYLPPTASSGCKGGGDGLSSLSSANLCYSHFPPQSSESLSLSSTCSLSPTNSTIEISTATATKTKTKLRTPSTGNGASEQQQQQQRHYSEQSPYKCHSKHQLLQLNPGNQIGEQAKSDKLISVFTDNYRNNTTDQLKKQSMPMKSSKGDSRQTNGRLVTYAATAAATTSNAASSTNRPARNLP